MTCNTASGNQARIAVAFQRSVIGKQAAETMQPSIEPNRSGSIGTPKSSETRDRTVSPFGASKNGGPGYAWPATTPKEGSRKNTSHPPTATQARHLGLFL